MQAGGYEKTFTIREQAEAREKIMLSPYASLSANTRGRERNEKPCEIRPAYRETVTVFCTVRRSEG